MPRPELHSADRILDAARDLVLGRGARAVTLDGIVAASGAPKGSIYHRFGTLNELLAAMWLRAARRSQREFLAALDHPDPVEAAVAAAMSIHDFSLRHRSDARLLASLRREDVVDGVASADLRRELHEINGPLNAGLTGLTRRLAGRAHQAAVQRTVCAVVDLPQGAVRRHLVAGTPLPSGLRAQLEAAVRAALAVAG